MNYLKFICTYVHIFVFIFIHMYINFYGPNTDNNWNIWRSKVCLAVTGCSSVSLICLKELSCSHGTIYFLTFILLRLNLIN